MHRYFHREQKKSKKKIACAAINILHLSLINLLIGIFVVDNFSQFLGKRKRRENVFLKCCHL